MTIATFIKDNTDDGRNIVRFLIDVMNGDIEGCTLSQRLTAARLLTVYGQDDAPNFIVDNPPDTSERETGRKIWFEIDAGLRTLIKARTDDGRVICMFLIDVMEGRVEGIHVGHRVAAARELLNRAFGKSQGNSLPRASRPAASPAPRRSARKKQWTPERARAQTVTTAPAAPTAVLTEPKQQPESEANDDFDPEVYRAASKCIDPNFDPVLAASNLDYWFNYGGCEDIRCSFHGDPDDPDFDLDPNDFHY